MRTYLPQEELHGGCACDARLEGQVRALLDVDLHEVHLTVKLLAHHKREEEEAGGRGSETERATTSLCVGYVRGLMELFSFNTYEKHPDLTLRTRVRMGLRMRQGPHVLDANMTSVGRGELEPHHSTTQQID